MVSESLYFSFDLYGEHFSDNLMGYVYGLFLNPKYSFN
jgi:hypothetical protein